MHLNIQECYSEIEAQAARHEGTHLHHDVSSPQLPVSWNPHQGGASTHPTFSSSGEKVAVPLPCVLFCAILGVCEICNCLAAVSLHAIRSCAQVVCIVLQVYCLQCSMESCSFRMGIRIRCRECRPILATCDPRLLTRFQDRQQLEQRFPTLTSPFPSVHTRCGPPSCCMLHQLEYPNDNL